jgi:hypothetical protein
MVGHSSPIDGCPAGHLNKLNEGSIPFTGSTIFMTSSGVEVASGETGDSFGDTYTSCTEATVSIPFPINAPRVL